jgi:hypothetical protein
VEPPVRIKLFGLAPAGKRTYLLVQSVVFLVLAAVVVVTFTVPAAQLLDWVGIKRRPPQLLWVMDLLPWIFLLTLFGEALETYLGLRRFAHKEALQKTTFFSG